ncbi:MAG: hypothetical protein A2176_15720 [Spirochaetes bacterium RBG_13_51_14]|nr:MAG: hypothetical protein A2176_15720 [Spirochaetes bacterium RBG_13_51_14]
MRYRVTNILLSVLFFTAAGNATAADMEGRFLARTYRSKKHSALPYRLLIPAHYDTTKRYPLVLFLHGAGERGTDNKKQLYVGLNIFADENNMRRFPCFVAAPQCPEASKWVDADWKADRHLMNDSSTADLVMAIELVEELPKEFSIDRNRLYITGYSMGGFGAWEAIQLRPDLFAAAIPVCGGGDDTLAYRIARVPIWAFHGARDDIVTVARSRTMINAVVMAGGVPRYTEYRNINHFCWGLPFSDTAVLEWLFRQKKR